MDQGSVCFLAAAPFEAARQVSVLPYGHRSRYLHGHSFLAKVRVREDAIAAPFPGAEVDALADQLRHLVSPLDYSYLNESIDVPTDENIARWIHAQAEDLEIETSGVQSTHDQGVDLDAQGEAHIWRRFRFEAAHQLPNVPAGHKCGRMHGHGFEVILHVRQRLGVQEAMGIDFDQLLGAWQPIYDQLHHACLNEIRGLENPTSELIAAWIWQRLRPSLPGLSWVTVYETVTAGCHFDGEHYRIWKEQRFESALRLDKAPSKDGRHRLHGHSYLQRLHLASPLDEIMGWTVDYGDVKELFKPVYAAIDHHFLNKLEGLDDPTVTNLLRWIRSQTEERLPELNRIDLFTTPGCGAMLNWGALGPALPV